MGKTVGEEELSKIVPPLPDSESIFERNALLLPLPLQHVSRGISAVTCTLLMAEKISQSNGVWVFHGTVLESVFNKVLLWKICTEIMVIC